MHLKKSADLGILFLLKYLYLLKYLIITHKYTLYHKESLNGMFTKISILVHCSLLFAAFPWTVRLVWKHRPSRDIFGLWKLFIWILCKKTSIFFRKSANFMFVFVLRYLHCKEEKREEAPWKPSSYSLFLQV